MTPEEASGSLPDLFARAVELDAEGRGALLAELATRNAALAARLARMLEAAGKGSLPIDRSPWSSLGEPSPAAPEPDETPKRIGPYLVLRELGRGGMGRVFLAEEQTEDFRRTVALKVIDRPGDADAVRRFRDEVRILSSLEHPGIARFLDGGRAADSTWFLALEYVEGEALTAWAATRELDVRRRVELFVSVLEPVAYAHGRGVVHRDLKPGHLLVDRDGHPRLLDFGISKLVDPESRASVAATRTESRALTPAYASPEQFRGEPVTPASDVYALGVVLYELLAGRRPFGGITDKLALERAVLEADPEPPSTAARKPTSGGDPETTTRAPRRGDLGRDLDAICLKALRKRPAERYADASELAADLRRFLDGLPVEARHGGRRYRVARWARRHRGRLAVAAGAGLAVAAVAALLFAVRVQRQAERLSPPPPPPKPFPFHSAEKAPVEALEAEFLSRPASVEAGAALALALGKSSRVPEARLVLARLRQIPGKEEDPLIDYVDAALAMDLGEPQRALVLFTRAKEAAIRARRGELVGQIRASRGRLLSTLGEREAARAELELARREIESAGDDESLWRVSNDLAIEHLQAGDLDRGSELLEETVAAANRAGVTADIALENLGLVSLLRGRPDLAEEKIGEVLALWRPGADQRRVGEALCDLAEAVRDLGRQDEALRLLEESISRLRAHGAEVSLVDSLVTRAAIELERAELGHVDASAREIEEVSSRTGEKRGLSYAHHFRGHLDAARGKLPEARRLFAIARHLLTESGDLDFAADLAVSQAEVERRSGESAEAVRLLDEAFAPLTSGAKAYGSAFLAEALRVRVEVSAGKTEAAANRFAELVGPGVESPSVSRKLAALGARAALADAVGQADAARGDLEKAILVAAAAGRTLDELELRLDLARLLERVEPAAATGELHAIGQRATALGLDDLARRAGAPGRGPRS